MSAALSSVPRLAARLLGRAVLLRLVLALSTALTTSAVEERHPAEHGQPSGCDLGVQDEAHGGHFGCNRTVSIVSERVMQSNLGARAAEAMLCCRMDSVVLPLEDAKIRNNCKK